MKSTGRNFPGFFAGQLLPVLSLALLCVLATGCPRDDYTVELKPTAGVVERTLTFYRADGSNSNGVPNYEEFSSNELAAITAVYPAGAVKQDGQKYVATGEFAGSLPRDVGGAGSYTNFTTSLGNAGFYVERFRGIDDLAAQTEKRFQAADQIADLTIGWTKAEFGRERGYAKLRKFLNKDFRQDLKNAGLYSWVGQISALSDTNATEEFIARFCQYLHERDYLKLSDLPTLYLAFEDNGNDSAILHLVQRWMAEKMGIPASGPLPKSFAVLNDPAALEKSWNAYLSQSRLYRAKLKEWKEKEKTNPKLEAPKPLNVVDGLFTDLLGGFGESGETDHLTVKLALAHPPNQSNGTWQNGQVVWSADLDPDRPLPVLCYANWSDPDAQFQKAHFGNIILDGDELSEYCLWQNGLGRTQVREWESFLANLQPGNNLREKLEAFQFTAKPDETNQLDVGRKLLIDALPKGVDTNSVGSK
jgi:hypothetical protein